MEWVGGGGGGGGEWGMGGSNIKILRGALNFIMHLWGFVDKYRRYKGAG